MPLDRYGVLAARPIDRRREDPDDDESPHYQIDLVDQAGTHFRAAVNVLSQQSPSELLFLGAEDYRHPILERLPANPVGWTGLSSTRTDASLDFIRGNLFDPADMRPLPPDVAGPDNDLADKLEHFVQRAIADPDALVYLWGQRWGPDENVPDKIFGFTPGNGVHDVHMNQGNSKRFERDDGVWQDGAMAFWFPGERLWVAVFLAFQSQAWHTDDRTGHTIPGTPPRPEIGDVPVRIIAALVNPVGPAPEAETVTLLNASPDPVQLGGWRLADRTGRVRALPDAVVPAGDTLVVALDRQIELGNDGGAITLLDDQGIKVDGVAYTGNDASRQGWTVTFSRP